MSSRAFVAVVIPAYNAAPFLPRSLAAAFRAAGTAPVLVVDAGSTDATAEIAAGLGAEVVRQRKRAGPAEARNVGAQHVEAEIVLFIDADCVVHADVLARVQKAFREDPALVSLTGSYDADPPEPNFASQYMNLRHHFTHQRARREDSTFWAGVGAVRRGVFLDVGGFDAERFPRPSIEDIELGLRLRPRGRACLDPGLQATHLKRWTLRSVVETDIRARALPWSELILESGQLPTDLNLRWSQRLAACFAPLALVALLLAPIAAWKPSPVPLGAGVIALVGSACLNAPMLRFFAQRRGIRFTLQAWLFHQVHLSYSSATLLSLWARSRLRALRGFRRRASPRDPRPEGGS